MPRSVCLRVQWCVAVYAGETAKAKADSITVPCIEPRFASCHASCSVLAVSAGRATSHEHSAVQVNKQKEPQGTWTATYLYFLEHLQSVLNFHNLSHRLRHGGESAS